MAEYYKYAERDADSQINWAEVGAETSGMLLEVNRVREEKKDALAQAQRESLNNLMNSPQGKNQDLNGVVNKFAHDMMEQKKIDYDLLTRGEMSVRDYTLKVQNQMDGTKRLFDITKNLQDTRQSTLDGIADGTLSTAINVFNRGMVEEYQDMTKLGINVNAPDGSINLGIYKDEIVDGKTVRVLKDNIASTNVILGKVAQTVPAFDINKANADYTKGLGSKKDYWYNAATTTGAGTITELTGVQFLENLTRPEDIAIVKNINESINNQIGYYFADENKLFDVLGDKLGKYNENSFTFNRDIADADENRILVTVNPSTGMTSLDKTGKNYKKQYDEAADFARTDILAKMDAERKISTTGQLSETEEVRQRAGYKYRTPSGDEAPPPAVLGEIQRTSSKDGKVKGVVVGLENLSIKEAKGVENIAKSVGYNRVTGAVELRGYQAAGKEEEGTGQAADKSGLSGKSGSTAVQQKDFVSSDKQNSRLLTLFAPKMPNPNRPGYKFRDVAELRNYLIEKDRETETNPVSIRTSTTQTGNKELD